MGFVLLHFVLPWTVILGPPAFLRWWQREPLSSRAAFFTALGLFIVNHFLFATATGTGGPRPILAFGAVATFWVLRWRSKTKSEPTPPAVDPAEQ